MPGSISSQIKADCTRLRHLHACVSFGIAACGGGKGRSLCLESVRHVWLVCMPVRIWPSVLSVTGEKFLMARYRNPHIALRQIMQANDQK